MCGITSFIKDPRVNDLSRVSDISSQNRHEKGHFNHLITDVNGHSTSSPNSTANDTHYHSDKESLTEKLKASISLLNHRGPDDSGVWINSDASVGLGHCRLSINDLTPSGRQPLTSDDGKIHAIVNGEIYDHARLRKICSDDHGYEFSSESDSELVLALYKIHGAPGFFEHLRGEFAFIIYDERPDSRRVIATRDRFGNKPLIWTTVRDAILIAAEAKAFLPMGWEPEWDVKAIVKSGWHYDDRTLFKGVKKVMPGHWLEITENEVQSHRYWDAEYEDKKKVDTRYVNEMVLGVRQRLIGAVRLRLQADVPVGVYLSGGIDSSALAGIVTHLAREQNVKIGNQATNKVTCFSIEFPVSSGFDESSIVERTADWLGVDIVKRKVTEETLAYNFEDTAYHCEHHLFDLNAVAKFSLSELPRERGIKVVITGEGADEHFAGYPFLPVAFLSEPDKSQPRSILSSRDSLRQSLKDAVDGELRLMYRNLGESRVTKDHDNNTASIFRNPIPWNILVFTAQRQMFESWVQSRSETLDSDDEKIRKYFSDVQEKMTSKWHPLHSALYIWNRVSLSNILLSSLGDRTEMAHSVEARTPFLDHHLVEYVNRLPPSVKMAFTPADREEAGERSLIYKEAPVATSFTEKWILREAVRPFITQELYKRKKHPFLAPMKWPRDGPLHRKLEELLTKESVEELGFIDYDVVKAALDRAFGDEADISAFRSLICVGSWVAIGKRLGVKKADMSGWI